MAPLRLLICDDAVLYATMMTAWLRDDPEIQVVGSASSAREGLEQTERLVPDVVLLDHLLPDATSAELVPQVRERAPHAVVVLISGMAGDLLARAAGEAGADAWAHKAATRESLRAEILRAATAG